MAYKVSKFFLDAACLLYRPELLIINVSIVISIFQIFLGKKHCPKEALLLLPLSEYNHNFPDFWFEYLLEMPYSLSFFNVTSIFPSQLLKHLVSTYVLT